MPIAFSNNLSFSWCTDVTRKFPFHSFMFSLFFLLQKSRTVLNQGIAEFITWQTKHINTDLSSGKKNKLKTMSLTWTSLPSPFFPQLALVFFPWSTLSTYGSWSGFVTIFCSLSLLCSLEFLFACGVSLLCGETSFSKQSFRGLCAPFDMACHTSSKEFRSQVAGGLLV